ncbi:unnamed protein product [Auanema sp. JU1783]|nr:unnamed protein product [Auanema sp. JU1783]
MGLIVYSKTAKLIAGLGTINNTDVLNLDIPFMDTTDEPDLEGAIQLAVAEFEKQKDRLSSRKVIVLIASTYDPLGTRAPQVVMNDFHADGGISIVLDYYESVGTDTKHLPDLASPGYYFYSRNSSIPDMLQAQCDANCFCKINYVYLPEGIRRLPTQGCDYPVDLESSYALAERNCDRNYGNSHLVVAKTQEKNSFVSNLTLTAQYLGLSLKSGVWTWDDGTTLGSYQNWLAAPTTNSDDGGCAVLSLNTGKWQQSSCRNAYEYICEQSPCSSVRYCPDLKSLNCDRFETANIQLTATMLPTTLFCILLGTVSASVLAQREMQNSGIYIVSALEPIDNIENSDESVLTRIPLSEIYGSCQRSALYEHKSQMCPYSLWQEIIDIIDNTVLTDVDESDETLKKLYRQVLAGYQREVRPALRHDFPINVTFVFSLTQIIDVDERNQILTTNAWVRQEWTDYKLVWDPRNFDNLTKIHIPHHKIWKPDIILYNNADSQYSKSIMSTDVVIDYLGNVSWASASIFKSSCPLDVKHYPFDKQTCTLKYASWAYDGTKIDLQLHSEIGDQTNYMMSTEWNLLKIRAEKNAVVYSCCPDAPYPFVDIHISIERRPMFYVFNLILPCVLISGIALLGFYMPSDSGEKVTLGITSLLSTTVFLMLVAEGMPPTSEALPLIGIYYGVTIVLVSLATAMTVFTLNVHHQGLHGGPVPPFLQIVLFKILAPIICIRLEPYHSITQHVRHMYAKDHPEDMQPFLAQLKPACDDNKPVKRKPTLSNEVHNEEYSINSSPKRVKKVSFSSPAHTDLSRKKSVAYLSKPADTNNTDTTIDPFEREFLKVMTMVHASIERNEMRVAEKDRRDATQLEWHQVAMVLDRFLLIVFLIGTALSSFVILYQRELGIFE